MLRSGRAAGRLLQLALGNHSNSGAVRSFVPLSTQADGVLSAAIKQSFETNPQQASHAIAEALTPEQRAELLCSICKLQTKPLVDAKLADKSYVDSLFDKADSDCPKGLLSRGEFANALLLHEVRQGVEPAEQGPVEPLPWRTLVRVAITRGIPFVGFGFCDNFIMIMAGEEIDATFGVSLGLSTMAAAGLGNLFADVAGISIANSIEQHVRKIQYFKDTKVAKLQRNTRGFKVAQWLGAALGVMIGCILGLLPLLALDKAQRPEAQAEGEGRQQQEAAAA